MLNIRITVEQDQVLKERARSCGFLQKSDYVRFLLFMDKGIFNKIDRIFEKVVLDGK